MRILALDSSGIVATAAVIDDSKLLAENIINHKKTHSEKLMPTVKNLLESVNLKPDDIDVFAAANGPGSFTGLRIGVATIKGIAHALNKPTIGVSSLDGLAMNVPFFDGIICPIIDAKRNNVYTAIYTWEHNMVQRKSKYLAIAIEEFIVMLKNYNQDILFLGEGIELYRPILENALNEKVYFAPCTHNLQRASSIAYIALHKAKQGDLGSYRDLVPFYLRKSQAERAYQSHQEKENGI